MIRALLAILLLPSLALARADVRASLQGDGFSDPRPVKPAFGNSATTLGEQRVRALERAFALWGAKLDSPVPIVVEVRFEDLGCTETTAVLARAGATASYGGLTADGADPALLYPSALANSLMQEDLNPDSADIVMHINSAIDGSCRQNLGGFYYGFDSDPGPASHFVEVILHELAHGLGFASLVDLDTGALPLNSLSDPFTAHIRDLDLDAAWTELDDAQRLRSATNVRRLVWDGSAAAKLVPELLAPGEPTLRFDRALAGYQGFVSDTNFAANPARKPVEGAVVAATGCSVPPGAGSRIAFFGRCDPRAALEAALAARLAGAILTRSAPFDAPAVAIDLGDVDTAAEIPIVVVSAQDAQSIARGLAEAPLRASLGGDASRRLGADAEQRPLLFTTQPIAAGSSVSHFEVLMRPNQLMEAIASDTAGHDLTLTAAVLADLGWPSRCGNGELDRGEDCDDGARNGGREPDGCRDDCRAAWCGDGVRDAGESCDEGPNNSDTAPDACRSDCALAACGDGVRDRGEQCDLGATNGDRAGAGCRSACRLPSCGDGIVDGLEQCDEGGQNDDARPGACRRDCRAARCGDGVVDGDEECDDGRRGSACRSDCTRAACGDGILDPTESCDGTPGCAADCTAEAVAAPTASAPPPDARDDETMPRRMRTEQPAADGCGCRIAPSTRRTPGWLAVAWIVGSLLRRRRRVSAQSTMK